MTELPQGGTARPMTRWGEAVMHKPCRRVESFDAELASLVADMTATMYAADGVGLAANQIGVDLKVFVFDCHDDEQQRHVGVVCNPVLVVPEGRDRVLDDEDEGCLSLPGAFMSLARANYAEVSGQDHTGKPVSYAGDGVLARCLQHETDHLDGTVFGDRLPDRARKRLFKEAAKVSKDFPPHWPADDHDGDDHGGVRVPGAPSAPTEHL